MQNDYIIRMLQQMTVVFTRIIGLKENKRYDEALGATGEELKKRIGITPKLIDALAWDEIINLITTNEPQPSGKCLTVAGLLKEEGDIYRLQGEFEKGYERHLKSLYILLFANERYGVHLLEIDRLIEQMMPSLSEYELPRDAKRMLFGYYETAGKYAKAENILFELVNEPEQKRQDVIQEGMAFYERLLQKNDEELEKGGLPQAEIMDGLQELQKKSR